MIFALSKFSSCFEDFNRRALAESDFFEFCEREQITVVFDDLPVLQGFTAKYQNKSFIFLDRNLRGQAFLWTAFHELAHVILHEPRAATGVKFYSLCRPSKEDDEADACALVALYPTKVLPKIEDSAEFPFERSLILKRISIYESFKI